MKKNLHITPIHPYIGRRPGQNYIDSWSMEPLPAAMPASLTPKDVAVAFYDDRIETIPFDRSTDPVMMFGNFFPINLKYLAEIDKRANFPLGDPSWRGQIISAEV